MKKVSYIILFCVFGCSVSLFAQQLPQYTQYFLNDYVTNPAVGGSKKAWMAGFNTRYQWVGIQDAPRTYILSLHGPVRKTRVGLGGYVFSDVTGPTRRTGASFSYTYHLPITDEIKLGMGVSGGVLQYVVDGSKITTKTSNDIALSNTVQSTVLPDAGLGFYLYSDEFFVSLSAPQLLGNKVQFFEDYDETDARLARHFFFAAGYKFEVVEDVVIQPSTFIKYVTPTPVQFDATVRVLYKDMVWAGVAYRSEDAVGFMLGYTLQQNITFGYSYDMPTSEIKNHTSGSHEVMLGIRFKNRAKKVAEDDE